MRLWPGLKRRVWWLKVKFGLNLRRGFRGPGVFLGIWAMMKDQARLVLADIKSKSVDAADQVGAKRFVDGAVAGHTR